MEEMASANLTEIANGSDDRVALSLIAIFVAFVVIVGSTGNILTILAIIRVKRLQTPASALVASLAVTDLGTVLITIPHTFSRFSSPEFHNQHRGFCQSSFLLSLTFAVVSVNLLQIIGANRYFIITKPRHIYKKYWGRLGTGLSIFIVWVYSIGLVCLPFFGFGEVDYIPELGGCAIVDSTRLSWWYKTVLLLTVVESEGIVTPVFFLLAFLKIRDHKRRLHSVQMQAFHAECTVGSREFSREEIAVTKMMLVVFSFTFLCWSPYIILHVVMFGQSKPGGAATFCLIFAYSNSMLNPFVYAGMNKHFRSTFKLMTLCHLGKRENVTSTNVTPLT